MELTKKYKTLCGEAVRAKTKAYAPYSKFHVGAALLTKAGTIYLGANIENASYGLTCCAERTAVFKAVLEGEREFDAVAIASDMKDFTPPCGACRQVLMEHGGPELDVVMVNHKDEIKSMKLKELLPLYFNDESLENV